jgi:hypothetical protein
MPGSPIKNYRPRVRKECRYSTAVRQTRLRAGAGEQRWACDQETPRARAVLYRKAEPDVPHGLWLTHFGFERDVAEALALAGDEGGKIGNSFSTTSGVFSAACSSAFILSMIGCGVPRGASNPAQWPLSTVG